MDEGRVTELIDAAVEARRERYLEMLRELVRRSAGGEEPVQQAVAGQMAEAGCEVEVIKKSFSEIARLTGEPELLAASATDETPRSNVVGRLKGGGGRSMLLFTHADSPPPKGLENWRYPPFDPQVAEGQMYGWGIADCKSGVAAMIAAVDAVRHAGLVTMGDVTIVSCVSKNRVRGMAVALAMGATGDASLYLHPAESRRGLREVKTVTAGNLDFRITVTGKKPPTTEPRHTPFLHLAENAVAKMVRIGAALLELDRRRGERVKHPDFEKYLGRSTNILLGSIRGGEGHKQVATTCVMECVATFPSPETVAEVQAEIEAAIGEVVASDPWLRAHPPVIEWMEGTPPAGVQSDHPLVKVVQQSIAAVTGEEPEPYPGHACSDIRIPMTYSGIPTVGYGPRASEIAANGAPDESIDVEEFMTTIKATALVLANWCGTRES